MDSKKELSYYARQVLLNEIGILGQKKLASAHVLIIGAGGLGCPVLQYLTGAGVGHIGIVDCDVVELSNLHRQVLFSMDSIGLNKAEEAVKILKNKNPFIQFSSYPKRLNVHNVLEIFEDFETVVDCSDNYETRFLVNDACVLLNKPLVYGSIYKFQGQVSVFNYLDGPSYRNWVPDYPFTESRTNCEVSGVLPVLPGLVGVLQANEVIKMITGLGEVLSGKVLMYDAKSLQFEFFELTSKEYIDYSEILKNGTLNPDLYKEGCDFSNTPIQFIDPDELVGLASEGDHVIIDVRELLEEPIFNDEDVIQIPLSILEENLHLIPRNKILVFACQSGIRSAHAISLVHEYLGHSLCFNLKNGITNQFIDLWIQKK